MVGVRGAVFNLGVDVYSVAGGAKIVFRTLHVATWWRSSLSTEFTCRALAARVHWAFSRMSSTEEEVAARGVGLYALYRLYNGLHYNVFQPHEFPDAFSRCLSALQRLAL